MSAACFVSKLSMSRLWKVELCVLSLSVAYRQLVELYLKFTQPPLQGGGMNGGGLETRSRPFLWQYRAAAEKGRTEIEDDLCPPGRES